MGKTSRARTSLANRVPAAILSSPVHRLLSGKRLVLTFTGRRSGQRYATPVNYLQRGRELLITTDSSWWRNLDGGAPVQLRLRGRRIQATAEAVRDPDAVIEAAIEIRLAHIVPIGAGTPLLSRVRNTSGRAAENVDPLDAPVSFDRLVGRTSYGRVPTKDPIRAGIRKGASNETVKIVWPRSAADADCDLRGVPFRTQYPLGAVVKRSSVWSDR